MSKFHINKHGVPAPCKAQKGNCPYGGEDSHFATQEEAQEYVNKLHAKEFGVLGGVRDNEYTQEELSDKYDNVDYDGKSFSGNEQIFNSDKYLDDNDGRYMLEDLDYLLSETIVEPRGEVTGWIFLSKRSSRYGSISNHGQTGYRKVDKPVLAEAIISETSSDSFTLEMDEGILKVNYHDHDGTHSCTVNPIVKSRVKDIERKLNNFDELIEYIKTMPSVKVKKGAED